MTKLSLCLSSPIAVALSFASVQPAQAGPDFGRGFVAKGMRLYPDADAQNTFYYPPGAIHIDRRSDDQPAVEVTMARYLGTAARGDQGQFKTLNTLAFTIRMDALDRTSLTAVRRQLMAGAAGPVRLLPLPLSRVVARPHLVRLGRRSPVGHGATVTDSVRGSHATYWTERTYTVPIDAGTAQLIASSSSKGRLLLTVSFAFFSRGVSSPADADVYDPGVARAAFIERFADAMSVSRPPAQDKTEKERLVKASALPVYLDAQRWPELLRRVDINQRAPAGYPLLRVRCYDFQDSAASRVREKRVEFVARGVSSRTVRQEILFTRQDPDLTAVSVPFRYAVRLDHPYRYRVHTVHQDGDVTVGRWKTVDVWTTPLDVSATTMEAVR